MHFIILALVFCLMPSEAAFSTDVIKDITSEN